LNLVAVIGNYITMHGHMNIKNEYHSLIIIVNEFVRYFLYSLHNFNKIL